jgi:hypothetical protein
LAIDFIEDNPGASEKEVAAAVGLEMEEEFGMAIDPIMLMGWIKLILELLKLWRERKD